MNGLMQLGDVSFEVWPLNIDSYDHNTEASFADHEVIGARKVPEYMGPGDETVELSGALFPEHFGGLGNFDRLRALQSSGKPQILVRGDGENLGWFIIENVRAKAEQLDRDGVGRRITFSAACRRAPKPSAGDALATILRLFL